MTKSAKRDGILVSITAAAMVLAIAIEHNIIWLAILPTIHITAVTVLNLANREAKKRKAPQRPPWSKSKE